MPPFIASEDLNQGTSDHQMVTSFHMTLCNAPVQVPLCVIAIRGGKQLDKRLISLGVRLGSEIVIHHRRGRSVVLAVGPSRIALGAGMSAKIEVEVI